MSGYISALCRYLQITSDTDKEPGVGGRIFHPFSCVSCDLILLKEAQNVHKGTNELVIIIVFNLSVSGFICFIVERKKCSVTLDLQGYMYFY